MKDMSQEAVHHVYPLSAEQDDLAHEPGADLAGSVVVHGLVLQ